MNYNIDKSKLANAIREMPSRLLYQLNTYMKNGHNHQRKQYQQSSIMRRSNKRIVIANSPTILYSYTHVQQHDIFGVNNNDVNPRPT